MPTTLIHYVTQNAHKKEEIDALVAGATLSDGTPVRDAYAFQIHKVPILETLEVDLQTMVQAEVVEAYGHIKLPCIVEHAGLVFEGYEAQSYPGGLTKPMWDTLGDSFSAETASKNRRAIARAVVAFCDGKSVQTFVGETWGTLAGTPRGSRDFYWDTVFQPDVDGLPGKKTYAEIVAEPGGLEHKVLTLSQSGKAMLKFLEYRQKNKPELWP